MACLKEACVVSASCAWLHYSMASLLNILVMSFTTQYCRVALLITVSFSLQYHQLHDIVWRYSFATVSSVYSIVNFVCGAAVSFATVSSVYSIINFVCGAAVLLQFHSCSVTLCVVLQFTCVALLFTIFSVCSIINFMCGATIYSFQFHSTAIQDAPNFLK